eukprot:6624908-Prymnesium_polylepis.2
MGRAEDRGLSDAREACPVRESSCGRRHAPCNGAFCALVVERCSIGLSGMGSQLCGLKKGSKRNHWPVCAHERSLVRSQLSVHSPQSTARQLGCGQSRFLPLPPPHEIASRNSASPGFAPWRTRLACPSWARGTPPSPGGRAPWTTPSSRSAGE